MKDRTLFPTSPRCVRGMNRRALPVMMGVLLLQLGCGGDDPTGPPRVLQPSDLCSDNSEHDLVTFEDPNLERALRPEAGAPVDLTCGLVSERTSLVAAQLGIESLVGIQNLTSLTALALQFNKSISDISPLSGLTSLTSLTLQENSISDLSPLSGLTGLTHLWLNDNSISDVSALGGLTSLAKLGLGFNSITDISPLSGLTRLTNLTLSFNSVTDISPLRGLTRLGDDPQLGAPDLDLSNNSISDISPLSGLTSLTQLLLGANSISDISALSGLTSLESLRLQENSITDISALSGLTRLGRDISEPWVYPGLDLDNNPSLTDIQPLLNNPGLGWGDFVFLRSTSVSCRDVAALEAKRVRVMSDCP